MPSAPTKLIIQLLMAVLLVLLTFDTYMGRQLTSVTALPITSKPIETTAENLAWQAWLMLPPEQKNQIKSRKVTPKSIFLLPLRGDCPPDHHKIDFKCIPITSGTNAMLIDPNVLSLFVDDANSTFDYDYDEEEGELLTEPIEVWNDEVRENKDSSEKSNKQDEPLKFNIFQNRFPTNYDELNEDYLSLANAATKQPQSTTEEEENHNTQNETLSLNASELVLESSSTPFKVDAATTEKPQTPYNVSRLQDDGGDSMQLVTTIVDVESETQQQYTEDVVTPTDLADILKKEALIPLQNTTEKYNAKLTAMHAVNRAGVMSNADILRLNVEEGDATTFTSIMEEPVNRSQNKTTLLPSNGASSDKLPRATTTAVPSYANSPYNMENKELTQIFYKQETETETHNTTKKSKVEPVALMPTTAAAEAEAVTVTPLLDDRNENDNDQFHYTTYYSKQDFKIPTTTAAPTNLITTVESSNEPQVTTLKINEAATTTMKNEATTQYETTEAVVVLKGEKFSELQRATSEIDLAEEWRLINELVGSAERIDIPKHKEYKVTTNSPALSSVTNKHEQAWENNPFLTKYKSSLLRQKPSFEKQFSEHTKSYPVTNSTPLDNNYAESFTKSSSTEIAPWLLNKNNQERKDSTPEINTNVKLEASSRTPETLNDQNYKSGNIFATLNVPSPPNEGHTIQESFVQRRLEPYFTKTIEQQSSSNTPRTVSTEYPIEPLLLKLWSVYSTPPVRERTL